MCVGGPDPVHRTPVVPATGPDDPRAAVRLDEYPIERLVNRRRLVVDPSLTIPSQRDGLAALATHGENGPVGSAVDCEQKRIERGLHTLDRIAVPVQCHTAFTDDVHVVGPAAPDLVEDGPVVDALDRRLHAPPLPVAVRAQDQPFGSEAIGASTDGPQVIGTTAPHAPKRGDLFVLGRQVDRLATPASIAPREDRGRTTARPDAVGVGTPHPPQDRACRRGHRSDCVAVEVSEVSTVRARTAAGEPHVIVARSPDPEDQRIEAVGHHPRAADVGRRPEIGRRDVRAGPRICRRPNIGRDSSISRRRVDKINRAERLRLVFASGRERAHKTSEE